MKLLDLDAPLVAGKSAAGFELGMSASDIVPFLSKVVTLEQPTAPINAQLATGQTFVIASGVAANRNWFTEMVGRRAPALMRAAARPLGRRLSPDPRNVEAVFFGEDVRLAFNRQQELYYIQVSASYRGLYRARFRIGSPVKEIHALHPLEFDDGDEVNYVEGTLAPGISFSGTCASLDEDPEQLVSAMCVHDWSRR